MCSGVAGAFNRPGRALAAETRAPLWLILSEGICAKTWRRWLDNAGRYEGGRQAVAAHKRRTIIAIQRLTARAVLMGRCSGLTAEG